MSSSSLRTFRDWNNAGYNIIKGSRATWVKGVAMFDEKQVRRKTVRHCPDWDSWAGAEGSQGDLSCCGGPMYGIYGNCD